MAESAKAAGPRTDETELIARLLDGDEAAFSELVRSYHPSLVRLARNFVQSESVAEEVAQETWLEVLKGLERFERRSSLKTWIFRILMNRARTRGERERRTVSFSDLSTPDHEFEPEPAVDPARFAANGHWVTFPDAWHATTPESLLADRQTGSILMEAINSLPPNLRAVIELRDRDQWNSDEVCDLLGISEANQRVLLHRARARVRKAVEDRLGRGAAS